LLSWASLLGHVRCYIMAHDGYVVASKDNMVAPGQERAMAKQMNAKTTTVPSSHVPMLLSVPWL